MKIIKTITDADFGSDAPFPSEHKKREAARAIMMDGEGKIALLHVTKHAYHKLPGGGIDEGESIEAALARELLEEIGCAATNVRELGSIEEFRNEHALHQISYCFLADLSGTKGQPNFTEEELADGFEPVWMDMASAISTLEAELAKTTNYSAKFMTARDLAFLKEAARGEEVTSS